MVEEAPRDYAISKAAVSYKEPEEQAPVGFMEPGIEIKNVAYESTWMYQKEASMFIPTCTDNTRRDTVAV